MNEFHNKVHMRNGWLWPISDRWAWELSTAEFPGLRTKVMKYVKSTKRIIQAGGCCGFYPKKWNESFTAVYTFEPDPLNFYCLAGNCDSKWIIKSQAALGAKHGVCSLVHRNADNVGGHIVVPVQPSDGYCPVLTIDDFEFDSLGAIQLDCEGAEFDILCGARRTLKKFKPVVVIGTEGNDVDIFLEEYGYRHVDNHGLSPNNPADRIFAVV